MPTFQTPEPVTLIVELASGALLVTADAIATTEIELRPARPGDGDAQDLIDQARIDHHGERVTVHLPEGRRAHLRHSPDVVIDVRVPIGSRLVAKTKSADVTAEGELGDTRVATGSGDVRLADVDGSLVVESGSGDVRAATIAGDASIKTASGDVVIGTCCSDIKIHTASGGIAVDLAEADIDARTASGDIVVHQSDGSVSTRTASGDLTLQRVRGDSVSAVAASGDVEVGVERGVAVWLDVASVSGTVTSDLEPTDHQTPDRPVLQLRAHTTSGDVTVRSV